MSVRFDDSLRTVMAADTGSAFGAQSAFRQLVDLVGRRRVADPGPPIDRLRDLRPHVPAAIRAASARSLALADPPPELVAFFAEDEAAIAAPVLRVANLDQDGWALLLPKIGPAGRALLRARAGLPAGTVRDLAAFGATDFTIGHERPFVPSAPEQAPATPASPPPPIARELPAGQTFAIADLVERIETFQRVRDRADPTEEPEANRFSLETDAGGTICWVEGIRRAGLIGRRLETDGGPVPGRTETATLRIDGADGAATDWAVSAIPLFASDTGRFAGYRGIAQRRGSPLAQSGIEPEALRRLVHELRTPTNAIAGFAELIATELIGPAPAAHRARATAIGRDVDALLGAIDDLEISARMDGHALDLAPRPIDLDAALAAAVRRAADAGRLALPAASGVEVMADERALDRLLSRLAGMTAGALGDDERADLTVQAGPAGVTIGWPWRQCAHSGSLLGTDFSLRLAQRLATTLGGSLVIQPDRLTLRLPASFNTSVQATTH